MFEPKLKKDLESPSLPARDSRLLTVERVREWVDVYREANGGSFPSSLSGAITDREGKDTGENWGAIEALFKSAAKGRPARGLQGSGFNSLKDFLDKTYPTARIEKPDLTLSQLQDWVDAYREVNGGSFPAAGSGAIKDREGKDTGENWAAVDALFKRAAEGFPSRGLKDSGFKSLADFLDQNCPTERIEKPDLILSQLKDWVVAYREANGGRFPTTGSGAITDREGKDTGETWVAVDALFKRAAEGFPARGLKDCGFNSLADFLDKTCPTERIEKPDLSLLQLKDWVVAYREATGGSFPARKSGAITDREGKETGETWVAVDALFRAAAKGSPARGLKDSGFKSLADFLDKTYPTERIEKPDLILSQLKDWVDAYREANGGRFPTTGSGAITDREGEDTGENWAAADSLFKTAAQGLPARGLKDCGFKSLADFLDKTYPTERTARIEKPDLTLLRLKDWVDAYREANGGSFPAQGSGAITDREGKDTGENWRAINSLFRAAAQGLLARGLKDSGFKSLADFLDKTYPTERTARIEKPDLTLLRLKDWVDAYREANGGSFPKQLSGAITDREGKGTGESWKAVDKLLRAAAKGHPARGLHGCGFKSLKDFLIKRIPPSANSRYYKNPLAPAATTSTRSWIFWSSAMFEGKRKQELESLSLPALDSRLLTVEQIREWVDAYREANGGSFPAAGSGAIKDREGKAAGENWAAIDALFRYAAQGHPARGLKDCGFNSLSDFLDKTYPTERKARTEKPDLTLSQLKDWVDVYCDANGGCFPTAGSGAIKDREGKDTGENWAAIDALCRAAAQGRPARGLQHCGFNSLKDFLDKTYPTARIEKPDLTLSQLQDWVDAYRVANGASFPSCKLGAIKDREGKDTGENWHAVDALFRYAAKGHPARGLQHCGFNSLKDFLDKTYPTERKVRPERIEKPDLTLSQLKDWVDAYREANGGSFPAQGSGAITDREGRDTGENWAAVNLMFRAAAQGRPARGLQHCGFNSLKDFLDKTYPTARIEKPDLTLSQLKDWVDAYREANGGSFPKQLSGTITDREGKDTGENWAAIDALCRAAAQGHPARGLQGCGFNSLADFLDKRYPTERKARTEKPDLTLSQLKDWVDVYCDANGGCFPTRGFGAITDREGKDTGESWKALDKLLRAAAKGRHARGLKHCGFNSLKDFLDKTYPTERNGELTLPQLMAWVDAYRDANGGSFPSVESGAITDREGKDTGENWAAVDALCRAAGQGRPARGLKDCGFNTLRDFLDKTYPTERKGELTLPQLMDWVDAYRDANGGSFPTAGSGAIKDRDGKDTGETWAAIDALFRAAAQGFPARGLKDCGFNTLRDFLDKTCPTARIKKPDLTLSQLKDWVDVYREADGGSFPAQLSGAIKDREGKDTGENWAAIVALFKSAAQGHPARGLKDCGFKSLTDFLDKTYPTERKARTEKPDLTLSQLKDWVDAYRDANGGSFPAQLSGAIKDREGKDTGENWWAVAALFRAVAKGRPARGLQGCGFKSLKDFLDETYPIERQQQVSQKPTRPRGDNINPLLDLLE